MAEYIIIKAGIGYGDFKIGLTNWDEIHNKLGSSYEEIKHGSYSFEMKYKELGISFYFCQKDPDKIIFSIHFSPPFMGRTDEIIMNKSTMREVIRIHGKPDWSTTKGQSTWSNNYGDIHYLVQRDTTLPQFPLNEEKHLDKKIIAIKVTNNCQCNIKFKK